MGKVLKESVKFSRQLDKINKAIKAEIAWYVSRYGKDYVLDMPNGKSYKSVNIYGCSYNIDNVRAEWWNTDLRISIDSHGLNYSCSETAELLELLQALEETFNEAA